MCRALRETILWHWLLLLFSCYGSYATPNDTPPAASFFVPTLPGLRQGPGLNHQLRIHAGHLTSDPEVQSSNPTDASAHLFFLMVKARRVADKERILFWFNGGPGCSSLDGLMMELGPWRMDERGELTTVEGGWEEYINLVFVDQPAGTGYSYTSTNKFVHGPLEASRHMLQFFENFFAVFPEFREMDMYLGGESYAGQYLPYFADAVLSSRRYNLKGVAIGNGWMDARRQYPGYLDYATKHGIIDMSSKHYTEIKQGIDECLEEINNVHDYEPVDAGGCDAMLGKILSIKEKEVNGEQMCVNIYDVRLMDKKPACGMNWPPEIHNVTTYLDRQDVVDALHASRKPENWVECGGQVHSEFKHAPFNSSITVLPRVLEKVPVLIFAGDQDFICNYVGIESMLQAMTWNGATGLGTVQTQSWNVAGNPAGTWVTSRNLTYVKVFNASHMAPFDLPHVAHDMILRFVGTNFSAILDGTAKISSTVGTESKPVLVETIKASSTPVSGVGKSPEQDKAMWEAYYNAGSSALVLVIILIAIGTFLWCRVRQRRAKRSKGVVDGDDEESIPLTTASGPSQEEDDPEVSRKRKGKEKEIVQDVSPHQAIFDVGEDDEDGGDSKTGAHPTGALQ